jgi:predicted ABC-type ATPase
VETGGHDVPVEKIISRYYRSIDLLWDAMKVCDRTYLFDNSGHQRVWVAEIDSGKSLELKDSHVPNWVNQHVLRKFEDASHLGLEGSSVAEKV